jgi:tRNA threonylcarbamoyladenosine biosynthesis protein TsaE
MNESLITYNENEIQEVARKILDLLRNNSINCVTLSGDLGSGKTTLVKNIGSLMGVSAVMSSPTYVIKNEYSVDHGSFDSLIHVDLYRIESLEEMGGVGVMEDCMRAKNLVCIEWPDLLLENKPKSLSVLSIEIKDAGESSREIKYLIV